MLEQINKLFDQGKNKDGYTLLEQYVVDNPTDQEQSYRLALVSEQLATQEQTINAYQHCLKVAPNNMLCYLYAGCYFLAIGQREKAISALIVGQDIDVRITMLYRYSNVEKQTQQRSYQADCLLRAYFTELHLDTVGSDETLAIVRNALWPQTDNRAFQYRHEAQQPHLFYLPELTAKAFWDCDTLFDNQWLSSEFDTLKHEFLQLADRIDELGEPYLNEKYKSQGFEKLAGNKNWTALHLYKDGVLNTQLSQYLPQTMAMLEKLPLYNLSNRPFEVFYSVLKAGQHITPHYGLSNHSLTVHLPIIVPGEGYIKVADEHQQWQEGQCVAFDDSFIHEAKNLSDQNRVVLIFSIWHPELTSVQQQAIRATFNARKVAIEQAYQALANLT
ncbi:aspartyl/asparaginyl beta-hydroxylase domain-containing protein [Colwellia sp. MEBiC06753]